MENEREKVFTTIKKEEWDLVIIGGGITGSGIMREAVRRNIRTLLVEQRDFSWGTSSRSGQLVHGGLRYLEQGNFKLTFKSVRERGRLLHELPGLVDTFGLMMTFYKGSWFRQLIVRLALLVYDIMSWNFRKHKFSVKDLIKRVPNIDQKNLVGGLLIYESVTDDSRLAFRVLQQAREEGGVAVNYCKVNNLLKDKNGVCGVTIEDMCNGDKLDVYAKQVINATGAWVDILRKNIKKTNQKHVRPLRGSHLVFSADRLPVSNSIVLIHPISKRPGFVMPWEGRVIVGNTDIDHTTDLSVEAAITQDEIDYLLENVQYHFPTLSVSRDDIIATFSGVRPVVDSGKADPSSESRDHVVWQEDGLLSVTGGKLTTFRLIALDALKKAQKLLGPLPDLDQEQTFFTPLEKATVFTGKLEGKRLIRLQGRHGNQAVELVNIAKAGELEEIPGTLTLWAELRWAAKNEAVVYLEDLMLRRTRIGLLLGQGGKEFLPRIREICQPLLEWNDDKWDLEEQQYLETWQRCHSVNGI